MLKKISFLLICLFTNSSFAHPVSYQGSTGVMTWSQAFMSDTWITYSFKPYLAGAARFMRMQMPEGKMTYSGAQLDYLLYRQNGLDHQANIYLYGGAGNVQLQGSHDAGYLAGFEADAGA